ncbi:DNA polymerase III subunit alpha, partial [Paenibacillus cymbidii]|uniref:DNA polymerase III subunit alpha n=1 Tax=Paenibacillus cymbidii TaxID=1639034 RepID=UPI00108187DB
MCEFVHLHVHCEYSLLDGAARIEHLADEAVRLGMRSLALTDHGVMYGAIPFYKACKKRGIKPIIGCEMYLTTGSLREKQSRQEQPTHHLLLLAKNETGYRNLMKLVSIAHLEGFHYKPRIDLEHLAAYKEGLVCTSACLAGEIPQLLLAGRDEEAKRAAERYRAIFGDDFYLELQDHGLIEQKKLNPLLIRLSGETGIPLVAANDIHYVYEGDHTMQDVLLCIGTGKTVSDEARLKFGSTQLYMKSGEEMARLFPHAQEALLNTVRIAEQCELELTFGQSILPAYKPLPEGADSPSYLRRLCAEGLEGRYGASATRTSVDGREALERRLAYELGVIEGMGYADYFLIVWDFIRFARVNGIAVGPGRGSSAGSLVAYVLGITDVDPIKYGLLFERFLNPERISMPDIDIDFSDERRDEVIDYVVGKYGSEHVAQIITFGTMAAKAAVRDVGRALGMAYADVDRAAKLIPYQLGITLQDALAGSAELKALCERDPKTDALVRMAMKVEGMPRHASTHAAGVVISREPLTRYVPLQEGTEKTALTQYAMEHLEAIGLLKMDFLGLRTLSIIERTQRWIAEREGAEVDFEQVSNADPPTYELLSRGDTTGIFQLESSGIRRVLKELKPGGFEDVISVLALYRPGPMDFIPKFIQAKHGDIAVEYPHESLVPILRDTYGIIVYQEQIMQIASRMAGFSLGEADLLRRAVSKKKREVLDEQRAHFVAGSLRMGHDEAAANRVYDMIVRFADYGFPRAHATAYGVLAFRTAYLKAHYAVPFMASMLTAVMGSHGKVAEYVDSCRRMGIRVLPPDVNASGVTFTPVAYKPGPVLAAGAETAQTAGGAVVAGPTAEAPAAAELSAGLRVAEAADAYVAGAPELRTQVAEGRVSSAQAAGEPTVADAYATDVPESRVVAAELRAAGGGDVGAGEIRFGLGAIKNVGTHAIEAIIRERAERPFDSLLDFCRRVDLRVCNKRVVESLIQAGAMDSLGGHRAQLLAAVEETIEAAVKWKKDREDLQLHLFGFTEEANWTVEYPAVAPFAPMQQLELERELLGLYLSGHPLDAYEQALQACEPEGIHELPELPDQSEVLVAGMVLTQKSILTRKSQQMAFIELEDRIEKVEVVLFPETWKRYGHLVGKGKLLLVKAKLQHQDEGVKLLADTLVALDDPALGQQLQRLRSRSAFAPQGRGSAGAPGAAGAAAPQGRGSAGAPGATGAAAPQGRGSA